VSCLIQGAIASTIDQVLPGKLWLARIRPACCFAARPGSVQGAGRDTAGTWLAGFVLIRDAMAHEMAEVGEIRVTAYRAGGFLTADSGYSPHLRALGTDGNSHVLVAVTSWPAGAGQPGDTIIGTIMLRQWPHAGEIVTSPDEAEIRALAVLPEAQGAGVGSALLRAVVGRAAGAAVRHLVLYTEPEMRTAHRIYERAGFARLPGRDLSPAPEFILLAYGLRLGAD
jgi:ribosomal protein S18 acetylase RimI-like enzyme